MLLNDTKGMSRGKPFVRRQMHFHGDGWLEIWFCHITNRFSQPHSKVGNE